MHIKKQSLVICFTIDQLRGLLFRRSLNEIKQESYFCNFCL